MRQLCNCLLQFRVARGFELVPAVIECMHMYKRRQSYYCFPCFPHHTSVWFKVAEEFFSISNLEYIPVQSSSDCHL